MCQKYAFCTFDFSYFIIAETCETTVSRNPAETGPAHDEVAHEDLKNLPHPRGCLGVTYTLIKFMSSLNVPACLTLSSYFLCITSAISKFRV